MNLVGGKYFNEGEYWCIEQHSNTNHFYDTYLPYQFHLQMVAQVYEDFKHLLPKNLITLEEEEYPNSWILSDITHRVVRMSCWGHDLIEDTRTSYNDINAKLGVQVADIVYAVSNEKGKSRKERANDKYYEGIRETPGAVFVKLCDRIANVQYSKMTKSRMFEMYKKENINFMVSLGRQVGNDYEEMYQYLINLFNN